MSELPLGVVTVADKMARVVDGDDFIRNLWDVHEKVKAEGYTQVCSPCNH